MVESMEELEAQVRRRMYQMQDLADRLVAVRVRESSPDGTVAVEVDGNGALLALELSSAISGMSPAEFERVVVDTSGSAARKAFEQRAELITAFNEETTGPR
ncbi:YbaB/EbfC family nucleoid-associated protein [Nocardia sp. NPDC051787]|uniref:YbaB/EbfC family nucleoid-associated protein n=1 Tax=Nocardia sp. NPDC051787 TaxID=3155415 RepID=UPI003428398E